MDKDRGNAPKGATAGAPLDLRSERDSAVNCGDMKRVQDLLDTAIERIRELEARPTYEELVEKLEFAVLALRDAGYDSSADHIERVLTRCQGGDHEGNKI